MDNELFLSLLKKSNSNVVSYGDAEFGYSKTGICLNSGISQTWKNDEASYALDRLVETLDALGLEPIVSEFERDGVYYQYLTIDTSTYKVKQLRSRGAGRKRKLRSMSSPLIGLSAQDALSWLNDHTEQEGREALGVSRSQYYKTKKALKELCEHDPKSRAWI